VLVVVQRTKQLSTWQHLLPSTRIRIAARAGTPLQSTDGIAAVLRVTAGLGPQVVRAPDALQRFAGDLRGGLRRTARG
ncbi:hypothetical protein DMH15_35455, partial [Streptomyces sp. WAC 06725]